MLATQFLALCFLSSCVTEQPRNAVPPEFDELAEVVNMPGARIWGDGKNGPLHADIIQSISDEPDGLFSRGPDGEFQYSMFGISSGAQACSAYHPAHYKNRGEGFSLVSFVPDVHACADRWL